MDALRIILAVTLSAEENGIASTAVGKLHFAVVRRQSTSYQRRCKVVLLIFQLRLAGAVHAASDAEALREEIALRDLADGPRNETGAVVATARWTLAVSTSPVI